jgi:virginiamycin A acetyltransferase
MTGRELLKGAARTIALVAVLPSLVSFWIRARLMGADRAFEGSSQALALVPGLPGQYLRRAFFSRVLDHCDRTSAIGFGTVFSRVGARIDEHVYIGPHCDLGLVHIEHDAMIAAGVHIPSGAYTHGIDVSHRPMREQPGLQRLVRIGAGAWIGNNAVVMADVGEDSIVGAGAVVTRPIPPRTVVAGVPARVIRSRESTVQLDSAPGNAGSPPTSRT